MSTATESARTGQVVLAATGIAKAYGGIKALAGADFTVRAGEVHGLIGENGSGKSTLLGIVSGQHAADSGEVTVTDGVHAGMLALRRHVAMVSQELSLAPDLTVAENILMSHDKPRRWGVIDWAAVRERAARALARLDLTINPATEVRHLRIDQQQMVELARAVELGHPVLVLDEPTSSLTGDEVAVLHRTIRRLADEGTAVVIVSHRMDELLSMTDRITVLRDGRTVDSRTTADWSRATLITAMLGYVPEEIPHSEPADLRGAEPALRVRDLHVPGAVHDVSLDLRPDEVVGLFGLEGSGRSDLLEAIFGARHGATGTLELGGTAASLPRSPREAVARGLALVPGDRKGAGLMLEMSIADNVTMARTARGSRLRLRGRDETARAGERMRAVALQRGSLGRPVGSLSGGNQQKVLIGKWLETEPSVLLLDEPTRGVDVGAKREIHNLVAEVRDAGVAVLVSSSDVEELIQLCDRFVVLFRGRVTGVVSAAEATQARLNHLATGGTS